MHPYIYRICFVESDTPDISSYISSELSKGEMAELVAIIQFEAEEFWGCSELVLLSENITELVCNLSNSLPCSQQESVTIEAYSSREQHAPTWFSTEQKFRKRLEDQYTGDEDYEDYEDFFIFTTEPVLRGK